MSLFSTGTALTALCLSLVSQRSSVVSFKNIALYPISAELSSRPADIITLDEGVKDGTIVITETGNSPGLIRRRPAQNRFTDGRPHPSVVQRFGGPEVNTLWLTNNSGRTLLLVAGEMLLGGQQDRIVQKDGLIPPSKTPVDLAVFCVEHGRWTATSQQFGGLSTGRAKGGFMGGGGAFAAPGGGRNAAVVAKSQQQVWDSVAAQTRKLGNETATGTYRQNYLSEKTRPQLEEYVNALMASFPVQSASGVVVAVNGKLIWMDRFDSARTFAKYWPKLLKSYALEAISEEWGVNQSTPQPTKGDAMRFAFDRKGKASFEGEEGVSKLTKVETDSTVLYELEDLQTKPGILVHANKATKQ